MTKLHFLYIFFAFFLLTLPGTAFSQGFSDPAALLGGLDDGGVDSLDGKGGGGVANQYSKKYQQGQNAIEMHNGLLPEASYSVFFVRPVGVAENQATLRMTSAVTLNGCLKMTQPAVNLRRNGSVMFVDVQDAVVGVDKSVRYSHFECSQGGQAAQANVVFDRDEMIENKVKTVIMKTGPYTDYFDVEVSKTTLKLKPRSSNAFKAFKYPHVDDPLTHVFFPENLIVLHVPQASGEKDLASRVAMIAKQEGLTSAQDAKIPLNSDPQNEKNFYFLDKTQEFSKQLKDDGQMLFGKVDVPEIFYGPNGPYEKPKKLDVYARLPGELD